MTKLAGALKGYRRWGCAAGRGRARQWGTSGLIGFGFEDPAHARAVVVGRLALLGVGKQDLEMGFEGDQFGDLCPHVVEPLAEHVLDVAAGCFAAVVDGENLADFPQR